ncbi:MAG TPA: adenine phosphoribosyltransferase [Candidatus Nitrosotalea sp.]|nr:adenine phosphoribosyltransferase [Candidatus Nitrosotalea sp.]
MSRPEGLERLVRQVPDFPVPGVLFRDITPLLADAGALAESVDAMCQPWLDARVEIVASMEARGFLFGTAVATRLKAGFVPVRKAGKLPWSTFGTPYRLEYGEDVLEMHQDAFTPGARVLLVDDVIATGGTAAAVVALIEQLGGVVVGAQFLIEIAGLGGRAHLAGYDLRAVITYT